MGIPLNFRASQLRRLHEVNSRKSRKDCNLSEASLWSAGQEGQALRSDGSWSMCHIVEISADGSIVIVLPPAGKKVIPRGLIASELRKPKEQEKNTSGMPAITARVASPALQPPPSCLTLDPGLTAPQRIAAMQRAS